MRTLSTERIVGSLLAGAIGDAWGAAYEGGSTHPSVGELPDGAQITDDTQLTLATCAAIERGRVNPEAIAAEFLGAYRRRELRGLGSATLQALKGLEVGGIGRWSGRAGNARREMVRRCGSPPSPSCSTPRFAKIERRCATSVGSPITAMRPSSARSRSRLPSGKRGVRVY